jgi:hypothetical protein
MLYKEILYAKIPIEQPDKNKQPTVKIEPLRKALMQCSWSKYEPNCSSN